MKDKGVLNQDIASYFGVSANTITSWIKSFNDDSFNGLCIFDYAGRRVSRLEKVKGVIMDKVKDGTIESIIQLKAFLQDSHGLVTCESNLRY